METFSSVLLLTISLILSANGQNYSDDVISTMMARLDEQQRQLEAQQRKMYALQEVIEDQKTENQRLTQLQNDVNPILKPKLHEFVQKGQEDNAPNVQNKRQLPIQGTIAFTAVLTHVLTNLGVNQNIVFDLVYTNVGDGYNVHHGVFTAPVSGVYAFHTTIFTQPQKLAYCGIVVNGVTKAEVYVQGSTVNNAGSQMVVLELQKGDDVAVQSKDHSDYIYGDDYTTFSGFLLQDLSDFNGGIVG